MKKIILTILAGIIFFACNKDDDDNPMELPEIAFIEFDIKKADGTVFEEGNIYFKEGFFNYDQEWWYDQEWHVMKKEYSSVQEKYFFIGEIGIYFGSSYYIDLVGLPFSEEGDGWLKQKKFILKYLDTEVIDTIWVKDSVAYPNYHKIDILLNGDLYYSCHSYSELLVEITKEEF